MSEGKNPVFGFASFKKRFFGFPSYKSGSVSVENKKTLVFHFSSFKNRRNRFPSKKGLKIFQSPSANLLPIVGLLKI